jgi:hypothetical protein
MSPTLITITQNDFGFTWNFTLTDSQGQTVDLTNASIFFSCQLLSDPLVSFSNAMSIVSAINGTCQYTVNQNDFIVEGDYSAIIKVQFGMGEVVSFSGITINVLPIIPQT